jgi:hypothetical protein
MSTSDPIAPDRLEALLRGEAGADSRERRMGALLDELTVGEIAPPAELRARVRSLSATPVVAPAALRRLPRLSLGRPRRLVPVLGGGLAIAAVIVGVLITQTRPSAERVAEPNLKAADQELAPVVDSGSRDHKVVQQPASVPATTSQGLVQAPPSASAAPLPDGQRAQDYAASLRLSVGSVAQLSRSTQTVLDTVRSLGGAVETVDYGTPSAGSGSALIAVRVPVARAQEALTRFSALGTITAQQVQIRDLQTGLDQESNRARALRHRIALIKAKLLAPTLTAEDRAALEGRLADSQTGLESVLRGIHATQQRAAFARFSLELDTGRGTAVSPPAHPGAFEDTADDALGVISVVGRGALFAAIVGGPFLLIAGGAWWLARRVRRRAARRLLETS